jgi:hypothetical protein
MDLQYHKRLIARQTDYLHQLQSKTRKLLHY